MHIRKTPLDDIAELLEVDPKVDATEDSVLAFLHLVLAMPAIRPECLLIQKGVSIYLLLDELVIGEDRHELVELFDWEADAPRKVVVSEAICT